MNDVGRLLYWSVRRELWESRWLYMAPLAAALVFLAGFLITLGGLPAKLRGLPARDAIASPFDMAAGLLMLTGMIVGAFYCLDAFGSERRDRSILFWKSLPVSDWITVLSKALVPLVCLPLIVFGITFALQAVMLLASRAVLWASGVNAAALLTQLSFPRMSMLLLYHLVTVHSLWQAPLYGWLLLVSAWAKRAAFLWAAVPVFTIVTFERMVFNTSYVIDFLGYRFAGNGAESMTAPGTLPMNPMTHPTILPFLLSPGLWIGLACTAVFLATATWLRHHREPL